jgi:hypothetical protein
MTPDPRPRGGARRSTTAWCIAAAGAIALATLRPGPLGPTDLRVCVICGPAGGVDAVLNVLLFMPLGIGLALANVRPPRAVAMMLGYSLLIELLQLQVVPGRDASVGDILTNSLGGCLGYLGGRFCFALANPRPESAVRLVVGWLGIWLAVQLFVAYTFIPTLPDPPYYGQIDRPPGHSRPAFPGTVLSSSVGAERLTRGELRNADRLKRLLNTEEGAPVRAVAVPGGLVSGRAELVVVSSPQVGGVVSLEQDGEGLLFGIRTGAELLRLRPYEFRLRGVFRDVPSTGERDTAVLHGQFSRSRVVVGAMSAGGRLEQTFVPRLSQGWIPFMPVRTYVDDDVIEFAASVGFLVLLIAPAGYWVAFARDVPPAPRKSRDRVFGAAYLAAVCIGLAAIPVAFGLRPAAVWEWACVVGGTGVGSLLARAQRRLWRARSG